MDQQQQQGFDLILASDVLYMSDENFVAKDVAQVFVDSVDRLLKKNVTAVTETTMNTTATTTQEESSNAARPKCCMAFQHRNVCVSVLVEAFAQRGFISYSPPGDYFQDIYGERGDERTMFNAMFLLIFERTTEEATAEYE
jgi:hypothetical protein